MAFFRALSTLSGYNFDGVILNNAFSQITFKCITISKNRRKKNIMNTFLNLELLKQLIPK